MWNKPPRSGHSREGHGRADGDGDGDSPAPGPRREPAQLLVVAFVCQGHLGSDEQDPPTGRGTRVSLRWTWPVDREQPTCPSARQWTMTGWLRQQVCTLQVCEGDNMRPPSLDGPLRATCPQTLPCGLSLSKPMVPCKWQQGPGGAMSLASPARTGHFQKRLLEDHVPGSSRGTGATVSPGATYLLRNSTLQL